MTNQGKAVTEPTKSDRVRAYVKANGPVTGRQISEALGFGFGQVWGLANPMVRRGILLFDEQSRYSHGRDALPTRGPRKDPAPRLERERQRLKDRAAKRKAERAARGLVGRVVRERREQEVTKRSERAVAAQQMRRKELGTPEHVPPTGLPCSSAFIAAHQHDPRKFQRLGNGVVSPNSQFQRLEIRA